MKIISSWHDDLIWCPSQCYLLVTHEEEIYTVYLRWRHQDPWSCYVYHGDILNSSPSDIKSSEDLFIQENSAFYFRDYELGLAKEKSINLAKVYITGN